MKKVPKGNRESIPPNFDFFAFPIFVGKLECLKHNKIFMFFKMAKLKIKKWKKFSFYEEKRLVGLTPGINPTNLGFSSFSKF
jgi:hypothetical protein